MCFFFIVSNADGELNNLPKDELVRRGLLVKETLYYISDGVYGSFNSIGEFFSKLFIFFKSEICLSA